MKKNLSMIVSSCDKFSDIWEAQIALLNRNWADRNMETILVTDKPTNLNFKQVRIFSAGTKIEFSERLKAALEEVTTEFVLITLDDYFLTQKIDSDKITNLTKIMESEDLDYIRIYSKPKARKGNLKHYKSLYRIDTSKNYSVNLYPGIWRVSFLKRTFENSLSAWEYEVSLSKAAMKYNANCVVSTGDELPFLNGVIKGKFFRKARKYLEKNGLYHGDRATLSISETFKYKIKLYSSLVLPGKIKKIVKIILRRFGYHFYTD